MSMQFCQELPKIELHAHLNGSLSAKTLNQLGCLDDSILEYQKLLKIITKTERMLDECFLLFDIAQKATNNKQSVYFATESVIDEFAKDNVIYLELRTTPRKENNMSKEDYVESVVKAIQDNKNNILVKLLLSINRRDSSEVSNESLDVIIKMKQKYPEIIKGVDLSGNPAVGVFDEQLFKKAREHGLFTAIHCGEVKNDDEVESILNFCPDRIGHATFLHPNYGGSQRNWELYSKLKIPTECCLTSNVICGTSKSYEQHHIQEWIKNDFPFSLNTDDKGVFCTTLSQEFQHVSKHFGLGNKLWHISYNSIDHSFASPQEKENLRKKLEEWKKTNTEVFNLL